MRGILQKKLVLLISFLLIPQTILGGPELFAKKLTFSTHKRSPFDNTTSQIFVPFSEFENSENEEENENENENEEGLYQETYLIPSSHLPFPTLSFHRITRYLFHHSPTHFSRIWRPPQVHKIF